MYKVAIIETSFAAASTIGGELEYEIEGTVEFGRQRETDPPPYAKLNENLVDRIVIAPLIDRAVPRRWFQIEPAGTARCRITNLSPRLPVRVHGEIPLEGDSPSRTLPLPFTLEVNRIEIRVRSGDEEMDSIEGLPEKTLAPTLSPKQLLSTRNVNIGEVVQDPEKMLPWLQTVLGLLQSAASTNEFFALAAKALVTLMGMDSGRVLLFENGEWTVKAAEFAGREDDEWRPSRNLLAKILAEKRTFRLGPNTGSGSGHSITGSMAGISMAVVSPILNPTGEPIGVLYGERRSSLARLITPLDAKVVELLAWAVANGLARVKQEVAAIKHRSMMEQFFTPSLARQLENNPQLLQGRRRDITVLFADIRRFSTISHNLGPDKTMEMLYSILSALHECVSAEDGVLVDFVGDELMAMWGAPADQPDHAARACRTALAMQAKLPELNATWGSLLGQPIDVGVGINSGSARVGNVGSRDKFKYGPVGSVVNLASRIQGINKFFKTHILVTDTTVKELGGTMPTRRLAQVRTVNIPEPATVYELAVTPDETWFRLKTKYEEALAAFELQNFASTAGTLGELLTADAFRNDGACLVLIQRAATCLIERPKEFSPVLAMESK
jgi:adenylate cyclase